MLMHARGTRVVHTPKEKCCRDREGGEQDSEVSALGMGELPGLQVCRWNLETGSGSGCHRCF